MYTVCLCVYLCVCVPVCVCVCWLLSRRPSQRVSHRLSRTRCLPAKALTSLTSSPFPSLFFLCRCDLLSGSYSISTHIVNKIRILFITNITNDFIKDLAVDGTIFQAASFKHQRAATDRLCSVTNERFWKLNHFVTTERFGFSSQIATASTPGFNKMNVSTVSTRQSRIQEDLKSLISL